MNSIRHRLARYPVATLLCVLAWPAHANQDSDFMKEAAQSGSAEIHASTLATTRANSEALRSFAKTMVEDHTKVANELSALAAKKQVKLPDHPSLMQQTSLKLLSSSGKEKFDARYTKEFAVKAHQDTIALFEKAVSGAEDPDVKAWAEKTLPGLKHHLQMAQELPGMKK